MERSPRAPPFPSCRQPLRERASGANLGKPGYTEHDEPGVCPRSRASPLPARTHRHPTRAPGSCSWACSTAPPGVPGRTSPPLSVHDRPAAPPPSTRTANLKGRAALRGPGAGSGMPKLTRVLWHLLGGTRGGPMRIRLIALLRERPYNTNQLATLLGVDYKTAQHHLRVLVENRVLNSTGQGYGAVFLPTRDMQDSWDDFDAIARKVARVAPAQPTQPEEPRPAEPEPGGSSHE